MPAVDARTVVLLKDLDQMGDEIVEDVVTAKMSNVIRLERRDQGQIRSLRPLARRVGRLWQNLFADGA